MATNFDYWSEGRRGDSPENLYANASRDDKPVDGARHASVLADLAGEREAAVELLESLAIVPRLPTRVPPGGFFLSFQFTLAGPFLSKDDRAWYAIENPVRREWAFRAPMIAPTTWKGNLRAAAHELVSAEENKQWAGRVDRLFGPRGQDENEGSRWKGRVQFFPTYFAGQDVDVINPHNRMTRKGKSPILFERVPAGQKGRFAALYFPFDLPRFATDRDGEIGRDLELLGTALAEMLTVGGFGAKKTPANNGRAEGKIEEAFLCDEKGQINSAIDHADELRSLHKLGRRE